MNATAMAPCISEFHNPVSSVQNGFSVVVVYQDESTFLRAQSICSGLLKELHDETEFDCLWIAFHGLDHVAVAKDAAAKAASADLVIFSAHAAGELPQTVKQWIESWLPHKNLEVAALAAMIGLPTDEEKGFTPIHAYLAEVAARGHMTFFPQVIPASNPSNMFSDEDFAETRGLNADDILHQPLPSPHWGINE